MNRNAMKALAIVMLMIMLHGCSSPRITMEVASQPNINPDSSGRPSPVIVKIYEMRGDVAFRQSDFPTLFVEPMKVLGADLVAADELVFIPGEARVVEYAPMPATSYVGVLAGFRQLERAQWRAVFPVNAEGKNLIRLELNDTSMISVDPEADWEPDASVRAYQERLQSQGQPDAAPAADGMKAGDQTSEQHEETSTGYVLPKAQRTK